MFSTYIARDIEGRVLYVGQTADVSRRMKDHKSSSAWWPQVESFEVTPVASREEAIREEARLLSELRPPHNVVGGRKRRVLPGERVEAVLTVLVDGPATTTEIRDRVGNRMNVALVAMRLHRRGLIKVVRYQRSGTRNGYLATWALASHPAPAVALPSAVAS